MGFMRAGEFTIKSAQDYDPSSSLSPQDISVDQHSDPSMICVHLKQSKTDPFRHGVNIYMGRTNTELCPVAAILANVAIRLSSPGPFFITKDGSLLTHTQLVAAVRQALSAAGLDTTGYSGHSFRIGAATSAARAGLEDSLLKDPRALHGNLNSAYTDYVSSKYTSKYNNNTYDIYGI